MRRLLHEMVTGARRLAATPAALGSIVTVSFDQFLVGVVTVLSVVVFKETFQEGVASYGRIIAAGPVQEVIDSLADLDVDVVATLPQGEQSRLDRVPANVRVVDWVPLHVLAQQPRASRAGLY